MASPKQINIKTALRELTLEEKINFLSGVDNWHLLEVERLGIPAIRTSDGPNGVRGTKGFNGTPAACLPNGTCLAATWDTELIKKGGQLQASEAIAKGASVILGPTMNMQRSPLGGRGFESYSEDPCLAGMMGAATVSGIQSKGVAATVKHFVGNDMEHERNSANSIVTERALREIYTMPFQLTQLLADPWCYMTSYGRVNGLHASENPHLLQEIVRGEWGADVMIMSDWFGTYSAAESVKAGLDLEMPGPPYARGANINQALLAGKLTEYDLDCRVTEILKLINKVLPLDIPSGAPEKTIDTPETAAQLREIASSGIVLLKNEHDVLPLKKNKTTAIIGPNAKMTNTYSGGGSASLLPYYVISPYEGIVSKVKDAQYTEGCTGYKKLPLLSNVTKIADDKTGLIMKCWDKPRSSSDRKLLEEVYVSSSDAVMFDFLPKTITTTMTPWYAELEGTLTPDSNRSYKFSLSVAGTGKLYVDEDLVIDNATKQTSGDSFFGQGTVEEYGTKTLSSGKTYNICLEYGSLITSPLIVPGATVQSGGLRIGCAPESDPDTELAKAVSLAKSVDQVIICAGLNADWESEGYDRSDMDLPGLSNRLIESVVAANPNTAVVLQSGCPVTMPWISSVPSVIQAWYGGNETGNAIADVLFGDVNPSGKLPLTYPIRMEDNPAFLNYRSERGRALYGEDVYIGYRYYEKVKRDVLFPFGHGLSYTTFSLSDLSLSTTTTPARGSSEEEEETLHTTVTVTNTGKIPGRTVLQLYIAPLPTNPHTLTAFPSISRPVKELKSFTKSPLLQPSESFTAKLSVQKKYATSYWDEYRNSWCSEKGGYEVLVKFSSDETDGMFVKGGFEVSETRWWNGL